MRGYSGILYNEDNKIQDDCWAFDYDGNGATVVYYCGYLRYDVESRLSEVDGGPLYGYTVSGLRAWRQTGVNGASAYNMSRLSPSAVSRILVGLQLAPGAVSHVSVAVNHVVYSRVVPDWKSLRVVLDMPGTQF